MALAEITHSNVVLETISSQKSYLSLKPAEKGTITKDVTAKTVEMVKLTGSSVYKDYNDQTRELFIDRMIESPMEKGKVTLTNT
ncbi:hypothetical protein BDF21DRAFT_378190 [Thamnidium elegans]|uniref:Uncharacterized protein n=1 Tax=Thamnidium elegans TaxID=101142 RepID=A0A8H7T0L9_9FUNG|nr:hypothetical protein INT48_004576 [Thamnidium elegans]KAI8088135.1 hypothetical protein BDF21DRAFT_378190 [Thamnidium elegans]